MGLEGGENVKAMLQLTSSRKLIPTLLKPPEPPPFNTERKINRNNVINPYNPQLENLWLAKLEKLTFRFLLY